MAWHNRWLFHASIGAWITALVVYSMGCADSARQVAREAAPGGLEGSIDSLSKPDTRQKFNEITGDATRQASHQAVLGMRDALQEMKVISPRTLALTGGIVVALSLLVLSFIIVSVVLLLRARRARARTRRQDIHARRIRDVLRATQDRPWGKELEGIMRNKLGAESFRSASARTPAP